MNKFVHVRFNGLFSYFNKIKKLLQRINYLNENNICALFMSFSDQPISKALQFLMKLLISYLLINNYLLRDQTFIDGKKIRRIHKTYVIKTPILKPN